jgi:hypothetical protein
MAAVSKFITDLKKDSAYKTWVLQFKNLVERKDRLSTAELKYYLVYDLDEKSFSIKSEYQTNYNMITLKVATIPPKKEIKKDVVIEDYKW